MLRLVLDKACTHEQSSLQIPTSVSGLDPLACPYYPAAPYPINLNSP